MPYKDLHSEPFDETTITKLEIFEDYAEAWIPTFVMQQGVKEIHVFDFFSGPGFDKNSVAGSPIRLLQKINSQLGNFFKTSTKVTVHLNEYEPNKKKQGKFELLQKNCEEYLSLNPKLKHFCSVELYNKDAELLFFELIPSIRKYPSLVYLDQNGIKFIAKEFILELEKLSTVDFIYFVSSSYFWRLGHTDEFKKVLQFDMEQLKKNKYHDIHRKVIEELKKYLPAKTRLSLFPFSLKKGKNIYGIIFGAKHYLAVDKFLNITWARNETNGEADFDIDEDFKKGQMDLFEGPKMTKVQNFKNELESMLLAAKLKTNTEVLLHTYEAGHIPKHAVEVIKKLKQESKLNYEGRTPGVNYDNVIKKKNIVTYQLI